jgi:hypothetical protein
MISTLGMISETTWNCSLFFVKNSTTIASMKLLMEQPEPAFLEVNGCTSSFKKLMQRSLTGHPTHYSATWMSMCSKSGLPCPSQAWDLLLATIPNIQPKSMYICYISHDLALPQTNHSYDYCQAMIPQVPFHSQHTLGILYITTVI